MNILKKAVAIMLTAVLVAPAAVNAATPSPSKTSIDKQTAKAITVTYNGKTQTPSKVVINGKTLVVGTDCVITGTKKAAGTYTYTIKGIGNYSGTATVSYTIAKKSQVIKKVKTRTYKAKKMKKKSHKWQIVTNIKEKAKTTYKVKGSTKYITVSKSGKVTLKKGIKKGTYKIVIKTKATKNYKATTKTLKIVIK